MSEQTTNVSTLPMGIESSIETETPKRVSRKKTIPAADLIFSELCHKAQPKWESSQLTLLWIAIEEFKQKLMQYDEMLYSGKDTIGTRNVTTARLRELDKEIDKSIEFVKYALAQLFGKEGAKAHFANFGVEKINKSYKLAKGRIERIAALKKLIAALQSYEMTTINYGLEYWTEITEEYDSLVNNSSDSAGNISVSKGMKVQLKDELKTVLNALINLIKANHPVQYPHILREWGFQKERY